MKFEHENRIIAHHIDGTLLKGTTLDFFPTKEKFHVTDGAGDVHEVNINELKAIFFVKDYLGDPEYNEKKGFFLNQVQGKKVMVEFLDGEVLFGFTLSYSAKGLGFFLFPGDPDSNNSKIFIVHAATKRVKVKVLPTVNSHRST